MQTDHELIRAFQNGNQTAFDELVRRHLPEVYRYFANFTGDAQEADDLAQEVFLKLYKSMANFRFEAEFSTYLYRVNLNLANTYLRRKRWKRMVRLEDIPLAAETVTGADPGWSRSELWDAVARLPRKQRLVVLMRVSQQLPFKDIDAILGSAPGAAKVNYHYGINSLKKMLHDE